MPVELIRHRFVDLMPSELEPETLYISIEYATVVHLCCCGCGNKTVTPLSPAGWSLTFDGETVSLRPSVGNGSFLCRSHYWITRSRVDWMPPMSQHETDRARRRDLADQVALEAGALDAVEPDRVGRAERSLASWLGRVWRLLYRR